jgi:hypothetical protein
MGFVHMDTDAVHQLMATLADAGRDLESGWQSILGAITGGEAAFGGDAIGQAIAGAYHPASNALRDAAERLPGAVMADSDMGHRCATDYHAADMRSAAAVGAVIGLGIGGADARP